MISDSQGQYVTGMDVSTGQSHVDYMPYGEIDRRDSDGPDIFRYKYSGQIEDASTGLYYYRARYYDPVIGRFTQADAFADPVQPMGLNRYMYTVGNPVRFRDPSGHMNVGHMFTEIIKHAIGGLTWAAKGIAGGARWAARGGDGAAREIATGGAFSRNQGGPTIKQAVGAVIGVTAGLALMGAGAILTMTGIGAVIGIPMMAAGVGVLYGGLTNGRAFIDRPLKAILGYSLGGLDFGYSLVASVFDGQPAPWVEQTSDGALVHNSRGCSIITGHSGSCAWGYVGHIRTGASRQVEMHERGHMSDNGIGRGDFFGISGYSTDEFTADPACSTAA